MRLAIVYWQMVGQMGGIATHLNRLRDAALAFGDKCDILRSGPHSSFKAGLYPKRKWVRGKDNCTWTCGEAPHSEKNVADTVRFLEANYDALCFGYFCPSQTKAYPKPLFLPLYDVRLPKVAFVMDGYWDTYSEWATPLLKKVRGVLCPQESYAIPLRKLGLKNLVISPFPFQPQLGKTAPKTANPSILWPCQWKNIKGIEDFLEVVPQLPSNVSVSLYSNGIRYYQLRTQEVYKKAVGKDHFQAFNGEGRAEFYGNVDLPEMMTAYQRHWFSCNLQGMSSRKETYKAGSYNNTEVEALWYGCCPILHDSTKQTNLPQEVYLTVKSAKEIPAHFGQEGLLFASDPKRRERAREFVRETHLASHRYQDLRKLLT